jgi:hypothetical protein
MEPVETKIDEPFGRQPEPVLVSVTGDMRDVEYWITQLRRYAEGRCGSTERMGNQFKIYPQAVND